MHRYLIRRLLAVVPVLFGISVLVFLMMALLPGDPAEAILGPYATPDNVVSLREDLGLDAPLPVRFVTWLGSVVQGDFGRSYALDRPVLDEVLDRLGPTALLAAAALLLSAVLGLAIGVVTAIRQSRWQDRVLTLLVLVGISTPAFWLGLLCIVVFAAWLGWFPVSGMVDVYGGGGIVDVLHHLVLPALALAAVATAVIARLTRTTMLEVLRQDFMRTASAKGLAPGRVVYRHAFRNAVVSVVPIIGLQAGFVLGGAVYIETVFEWPGLGRMLVNAIGARDILLVQGGVLIVATGYVLINLITDVVQYVLDPRIEVH
jgi:peptide/nickel transport system permease protein